MTTEPYEVSSFWGLFNQPASIVEYEWAYEVENLTDKCMKISVSYELKNHSGGVLDRDEAFKFAEPGEIVTIEGTGKMDYLDAKNVRRAGWSIWHAAQ